jgi:ABC-type Na+ transport system ATPase subunit NatA
MAQGLFSLALKDIAQTAHPLMIPGAVGCAAIDALSSVDTLTEERILNHLAEVMRGRTVILISYRVSTVRQADQIVALKSGRIVEHGTHAELIAAGGSTPAFRASKCGRRAGSGLALTNQPHPLPYPAEHV